MLRNGDKIIFAGDSTTDAEKTLTADGLGNGYVKLVRDALFAFCPFHEYRVINAGVSGNTSKQLVARWENDVTQERPDVVFCMIGINDVWRYFDFIDPSSWLISEDEYRHNLVQISEMTQQIREFRWMTPFFLERNHADEMREMTQRYTDILREVALQYGRKLLDLQKEFDEYMLSRPGQSISWDRVHPGAIGSHIIARAILREMHVC